ncbi:MAG TPA: hypothetical protein VK149_12145 [Sideroxyarcus sp.]|nr:hypothetical protein [Sideroxyarcus sp.]
MSKDKAQFARSGTASLIGKRTEKVRCGNVPLSVKHKLDRMRASNGGKSEAEYVAMLVTIHVLGVDAYRRLQEEELQSFVIPGQELDKAHE